jgi:hypothetical protein
VPVQFGQRKDLPKIDMAPSPVPDGPPFYLQTGHRKTWELDGAAARTPVGRYSRIAM